MKKQVLWLAAALMMTTSCGSLKSAFTPTKMDTVEATTKVVEALKKNIDFNEWKVYNVRWMEAEELENDLLMVSVDMINKSNDCFSQVFHLGGSIPGHVGDLSKATGIGLDKLTFDAVKGITVDMINPEAIQKQYEAAKATIPAEYDFKSIGNYELSEERPSGNKFLDRDKEIGKVSAQFDINMTERGKEYVESAGKRSLQYYEATFNVLPDGSIELDE